MEEKKQIAPQPGPLESAGEISEAIEAILYAAGYPVRYDKLAEVLGLTVRDGRNDHQEECGYQFCTWFCFQDLQTWTQCISGRMTCS